MRLEAETDRADLAERGQLRTEAELSIAGQALEESDAARRKAERRAARLVGKVKELQKVVRRYDNAHTPPAQRTITQRRIAAGGGAQTPSCRKRGAQKGHRAGPASQSPGSSGSTG